MSNLKDTYYLKNVKIITDLKFLSVNLHQIDRL